MSRRAGIKLRTLTSPALPRTELVDAQRRDDTRGMIRVLVAEDMRILRDTLVAVLSLEDDIEVVADVASGNAIIPAPLAAPPDVAVIDIDVPGTDGITAAKQLREKCPAAAGTLT